MASYSIDKSVGDPRRGARNDPDDVRIVQRLLNMQMAADNETSHKPLPLLEIDGDPAPTLEALVRFQERERISSKDEPVIGKNSKTFKALADVPDQEYLSLSFQGFAFIKDHEGRGHYYLYNDSDKPDLANCSIGYGYKIHHGGCKSFLYLKVAPLTLLSESEDLISAYEGGVCTQTYPRLTKRVYIDEFVRKHRHLTEENLLG